MKWITVWNERLQSILAFSFLSAYILSFLFEGQMLYGLLGLHGVAASGYVFQAIVAHFFGLLTCGLFVKSTTKARLAMFSGIGISLATTIPFFFDPSLLWSIGLVLGGFASGAALAAWGYFLKALTPKKERLRTCADVLICSNIMMVVINFLSTQVSPLLGLLVVMFSLSLGMVCSWNLNVMTEVRQSVTRTWGATENVRSALFLLCLFIAVLTINSGLMYQVINPAFEHLNSLTSWYWSVPYILVLLVLRNLPGRAKHSILLYVGMAMMVGAFICFMFLTRNYLDYLVIDTLMLAACGVFDLFWWSILGEMLDYTENPSQVFGVGLSANVLGVLSGGVVGFVATSTQRLTAEVTVMGLTVVCVTLAILPLLNRRLVLLLKNHAYLVTHDAMGENQQTAALYQLEALDPLTAREGEVLEKILSGMSNREIAAALYITESTVKTHVRNIFSKYAVHSRAELISSLLKGEDL